ncbi:MAG: response regulator [Alphaproteobacteria bacterium]|nr:response regulator [Alphaproteobacteria bacterium]
MWRPASHELVQAAVGRRRQLRLRLLIGLGVGLAMGSRVGWWVSGGWLLCWYALQGLEFAISGMAGRRADRGVPVPAAPLLGLLFLTNAVFAAMGVLCVRSADGWTMIAGGWVLAGGLLNAAATSRSSRAAFLASAAPAALLCATLPAWAAGSTPSLSQAGGIIAAAVLLLVATHVLRAVGLSAIAEAREASAAKSRFLANISHEIRTPLNGIIGMAEAISLGELSPVQRERLDVARRSGAALMALLNDVLDYSKIEAGKLDLEDGRIDLGELARDLQHSFRSLAASKDLTVQVVVTPSARGWWRGDPVRVRQIISNLLSNAVKFTERGAVEAELSYQAPWLTIMVSDTGPGMSPETVAKLFGAFVQADASTTRKFGGSGLGLAICRELATLMGGDIEVASELGEGTRFRVRLPLEPTEPPLAAQPEDRAPPAPSVGGCVRILVAEDHETNRAVLKAFLEHVGIEATFVDDGEKAASAAEAGVWDAILMDVQMPVMDGLEAVQVIRARESRLGLPPVPIIGLTANAMPHQVEAYVRVGMDAVVAKPVQMAVLMDALAAALDRNTADAGPARRAQSAGG